MIDVEQQLLAAENVNDNFVSLIEELARLQSERKAKKVILVLRKMKTGSPYGDPVYK